MVVVRATRSSEAKGSPWMLSRLAVHPDFRESGSQSHASPFSLATCSSSRFEFVRCEILKEGSDNAGSQRFRLRIIAVAYYEQRPPTRPHIGEFMPVETSDPSRENAGVYGMGQGRCSAVRNKPEATR